MDLRTTLGELWPHFDSADLDTIADQLDGLSLITLGDNITLFSSGEESDTCWLILSGTIDEWIEQNRAAVRSPGEFIGEVSTFARSPLTTTCEGRTDCVLLEIPGVLIRELASFPFVFANWFLGEVARHATQWAAATELTAQYGELQTYPYCNSSTFPGPYEGIQCELVYLFCKREGEEMALATPPRVSWMTDAYMICAAHYPDFHSQFALKYVQMKYSEVSVMVPAWVEGQDLPQILMPYVYADSVQPVLAGREVFGYPKMKYPVAFDSNVGLFKSDRFLVRKEGVNVIRATYETVEWESVDASVRAEALRRWLDPHGQQHPDHERVVDASAQSDSTWLIDLYNSLPQALRTLGASTWKRSFDPSAFMHSPGPIEWNPDQFQVDGIAGSKFIMSNLTQIDFVVPIDFITTDGFIDHEVNLALPVGLRVVLDMQMVPAAMQQDYLTDPPTSADDLRKMMWGPRSWAHVYGVPEAPSTGASDASGSSEGASSASSEASESSSVDGSAGDGAGGV